MGEVIPFRRRAKLTGFIPATLGMKPAVAMRHDVVTMAVTPLLVLGAIFVTCAAVWFSEGWRER